MTVERGIYGTVDARKLNKPTQYEVIKRPTFSKRNLPLLYPEKPSWSVEEGYAVMHRFAAIDLPKSFFNHMCGQRKMDAWMNNFYYVAMCNVLRENEDQIKFSLKQWYEILQISLSQQLKLPTQCFEGRKLSMEEFIKLPEFLGCMRDAQSADYLSFDFLPQKCNFCSLYATSLPVCECGESYCSPPCRLADLDIHEDTFSVAMQSMMCIKRVDRYWLAARGYRSDCEGRPLF